MTEPDPATGVDELLDRAISAIADGDHATATELAEQVLALDQNNPDAEDLLSAPSDHGEIRRLTIMFVDLVDSTALSTRIALDAYHAIVGRYQDDVARSVRHYEGYVVSTKGDGLLALFGHPQAHEDDGRRAVQAGLDITRAMDSLNKQVRNQFGLDIAVRVGVHRGIVYLDTSLDDVFGLAANLAARVCSLAEPGTVAVSEAIERVVGQRFELQERPPAMVKGIAEPVRHFIVIGERDVATRSRGPLVGRGLELAYLESCWAEARSGALSRPGVAFIGDAGIGKSRLAWSAVDLAEQSQAVVIQLIGSPFHTDVGLRPVRRLLERRCGIGRGTDPRERLGNLELELAAVGLAPAAMAPLLAPVLGIRPDAGYQAVAAEGLRLLEQIANAVHEYLLACLRGRPALLLVEDMHWFDEDTVDVVRSVLDADMGGQALVVMTSRNRADAPDGSRAQLFEIQPLSSAEVDSLITTIHPGVSSTQLRAVQLRCDGIPLFVEELVAKLKSQPHGDAYTAGVPDTLYETLFARLRSTAGTSRVVEAAAIIGSRIERGLLASVVELTETQVDDAIAELVHARVLELVDDDSWRFRHELLREVAAELAPPTLRRSLHGRIADAMSAAAAAGNPDWPFIARHYERAERYAEAAATFAMAADSAARRGALGESRNYLSLAVDQVELAQPNQDRDQLEIALRLRRAFLAQAADGVSSPNVAADFERCLSLCGKDLRDDTLLSTLMSLYPYYTMKAELDRAKVLVDSIRASLTGTRRKFIPINDFAHGMLAWYRGEFESARDYLDYAAKTLVDSAATELDAMLFMPNHATAGLYTHLALSRFMDGDLTGVDEQLAEVERICARLDFPKGAFSLAYARQTEVLIRIEAGQFERAGDAADAVATLGEEHGFDSFAMFGLAQRAVVDAAAWLADSQRDDTELPTHIGLLGAYVEAFRELGLVLLVTFYDAVLARLLIAAGQHDDARARVQTALDLSEQTGMRFNVAELLRLRAQTSAFPAGRSQDLRTAVETARRQDSRIFELRSAMDYFALDGHGDARSTLADAVSRFDTGCTWPELAQARAALG